MLQRGKRLAQKEEPLYSPGMSETANLDQLAERFVDLWQDQMTAMAGDPELARLMRRMLGLWGLGPSPFGGTPFDVAPEPAARGTADDAGANGQAGAAVGAAAARPAPGDARAVFVELGRRLDALEERLARLETGSKGSRPRPRAKSRRRKAG